MKRELAITALKRAIVLRNPPPGLVHHSDRGSQYCSGDYQKLVKAAGFVVSMSAKGNCYDNAMVETVFKTIKSELVWRTIFLTRMQAHSAIARYIDGFYNPRRRLNPSTLPSSKIERLMSSDFRKNKAVSAPLLSKEGNAWNRIKAVKAMFLDARDLR